MTGFHHNFSEIFYGLARVLSYHKPLPEWFAASGNEWPLFYEANRLSIQNSSYSLGCAIDALAHVSTSTLDDRQREYEELFVGRGYPPIWLYESYHLDGRVPGPTTFSIKKIISRAGLDVDGSELHDHASVELAFLAYLDNMVSQDAGNQETWRETKELFIKNHAGKWLPDVGLDMIRSAYPAWVAIGHLLIASLDTTRPATRVETDRLGLLPTITHPEECILCGFCVQVCKKQALRIREDEQNTELWLIPDKCNHCSKCFSICEQSAITFSSTKLTTATLLRQSTRAICPSCGDRTVSQAEINAIVASLDEHPLWLDYCLGCRYKLMEKER